MRTPAELDRLFAGHARLERATQVLLVQLQATVDRWPAGDDPRNDVLVAVLQWVTLQLARGLDVLEAPPADVVESPIDTWNAENERIWSARDDEETP